MSREKLKAGPKARVGKNSTKYVKVRTTDEERDHWRDLAAKAGAADLSAWLRDLVHQAEQQAA